MATEYKLSYPAAEINEKLGKIVDLDTTLTHEGEAADAKATGDAVGRKVDKVDGKGLSTHDYDNAAKAKVDAIPEEPKYTDTVYDDTEVKQGLNQIKDDLSNKLPKSPANWEPWTAEEQAAARERIGIHKVTEAEYDALTDTSGIYIIVEE